MVLVMFPYVLFVFYIWLSYWQKKTQLALTYSGAHILCILCNSLDIFKETVPPKLVTYL